MTIVDVKEAGEHLSALVDRAEAGEEIHIARDGRPVVELLARRGDPSESPRLAAPQPVDRLNPSPRRDLAGALRDDPWLASIDLDAPLDEEVARAFGMLDE